MDARERCREQSIQKGIGTGRKKGTKSKHENERINKTK
jgi:hypothetical protein